ncbi:MAG: AAA-like domain-containing protein, partial [Cyanobacteria bacterium P01_D01_bin.14]
MTSPTPSYEYQVGGSLKLASPTYVTRRADTELYEGLRKGDFCYVLNSRQMGKSSLRVRTMAQLQSEGVACVAIQMTDIIEEEMSAEEWYAGVINSIVTDLGLDFDDFAWWDQHQHLSLVNRFSKFLDDVLLRLVETPLVIFIDEIDRILSLPFTVNGFFAVVRECFNKRADQPKYQRLTFALLGVATPSDLIADKRSTPFNVGRAIELTGFTLSEAQPLAAGLAKVVPNPKAVLAEILRWTGGQPFLTQKVCRLITKESSFDVRALMQAQVIQNWEANDEPEHLRTIRDRLLRDEQKAGRRIGLYQQILAQGSLAADAANVDHIELRLSGLVVERQGRLEVYNPTYRAVFDEAWAAQALANLRPYSASITAWLESQQADPSRLLRGQALEEARQWAGDKVLPPEDYLYLAASQELATAEVEQARQTLAQANQTLAQANEQANERIASANRRLKIGSTILMGTVVLSVLAGGYAQRMGSWATEQQAQAEEQLGEADEKLAAAQTDLDAADDARRQAEADKAIADEDKQAAEEQLEEAETESEAIKQESEQRIAEADRQVSEAAQQANNAQVATEQARQEQAKAQQAADEARQASDQARADAVYAQAEQERAKAGTALERRGIALVRRQDAQFASLDTLLDALEEGHKLNSLMSAEEKQSNNINNYPAKSTLLGLRISLNSVLETTKFEGEFRGFSDDGQRLVAYSYSDSTTRLYDLSGNELGSFEGEFRGFSDDGQRLVAYSYSDSTNRLYDLSGKELGSCEGAFLGFSDDGQRLV